jgi:spermidine/putrescine transport system permease protein
VGPAVAYLVLLFLGPLAVIGAYSIADAEVGGWTLENYRRAFDPLYLDVLLHSAGLALATTLICLAVAYPCVLVLREMRPGPRLLVLALLIIPSWLNLLVKNYAWIILLRREGVLNSVLLRSGIVDEALPLLFNDGAVLVGLVHTFFPYMVLALHVAVERMDWSLVEAARDLGAGAWQAFRSVILPETRAGALIGSVLVFVPTLGAFVSPDLLGGTRSLMVANLIENQVLQVRDWPFAAALSMTLMSIVAASLLIVHLMTRPRAVAAQGPTKADPGRMAREGGRDPASALSGQREDDRA